MNNPAQATLLSLRDGSPLFDVAGMKNLEKVVSSETYDINPKHLRALGVERLKRNRTNAYRSHPEHKHKRPDERALSYEELKERIRRQGFRRDCPITILLNRKDGKGDQLLHGHHRLAIAIELGLPTVPVRFAYPKQQKEIGLAAAVGVFDRLPQK